MSAQRARPARKALRTTLTFGGLAAAATGVAVAAGVVHTPGTPVNLADSLSPALPPVCRRSGPGGRRRPRRTVPRSCRAPPTGARPATPPRRPRSVSPPAPPSAARRTSPPQDPQDIAEALLPTYGWSSSQMSCLVPLWMGESGWRVNAENSSSGAYGIPQSLPGSKMATAGADWQTNPATQIKWGLGYIQERYGSPCGAWGFKQGHGWY